MNLLFFYRIAQGIVDREIFSFWINRDINDPEHGGLITFGGLQINHCFLFEKQSIYLSKQKEPTRIITSEKSLTYRLCARLIGNLSWMA